MRGGWRRGFLKQKIKDKINEVWEEIEKKYGEEDEMVMMVAEGSVISG
jgi:hypoxanthine-guanine phosphoribosyltransferase